MAERGDLRELGITGYPESHHLIDDETTIQAMFEKEPHATYIVSQICFDAEHDPDLDRARARARDDAADLGRHAGRVDNAKLRAHRRCGSARRVGADGPDTVIPSSRTSRPAR